MYDVDSFKKGSTSESQLPILIFVLAPLGGVQEILGVIELRPGKAVVCEPFANAQGGILVNAIHPADCAQHVTFGKRRHRTCACTAASPASSSTSLTSTTPIITLPLPPLCQHPQPRQSCSPPRCRMTPKTANEPHHAQNRPKRRLSSFGPQVINDGHRHNTPHAQPQ